MKGLAQGHWLHPLHLGVSSAEPATVDTVRRAKSSVKSLKPPEGENERPCAPRATQETRCENPGGGGGGPVLGAPGVSGWKQDVSREGAVRSKVAPSKSSHLAHCVLITEKEPGLCGSGHILLPAGLPRPPGSSAGGRGPAGKGQGLALWRDGDSVLTRAPRSPGRPGIQW